MSAQPEDADPVREAPIRVWVNRSFATSVHLVRQLRDNPSRTPVELFGSHVDPTSPVLAEVDRVLPEPDGGPAEVAEQCLQLCRRHRIQVFIPTAWQEQIAARRADFEASGTALVCPPLPAISLLADKADTYAALGTSPLVPPWRRITDVAGFDAACAALADRWTVAAPLVIKPARGVGADGVRFLTRTATSLAHLLGPVGPMLAAATFRAALASDNTVVPTLLAMPYLPGPETSVDVLADHGRALVCIPRTKSGRQRVIGGDPRLAGLAAELVARFGLDGLINVQFRTLDGQPVLLEINTRPSGGLHQSSLAGPNLVWWAVRLALGWDPQLQAVRLGARYVTVDSVVRLRTSR